MPTYHRDIPANCPLPRSAPHSGLLYRGVKRAAVAPADFLSHAERPNAQCDRTQCQAWGLSVWLNINDVHFARGDSSFLRTQRFIAQGTVNSEDGSVLHTPSNDQPDHYTFWKDISVNFAPRFHVIIEPERGAT